MDVIRHGDVLLALAPEVPSKATKRSDLVLFCGEITGHSHQVKPNGKAALFEYGRDLFLEVTNNTASLIHEEHQEILLQPGIYRVWRQREYDPDQDRDIED